VERRSQAVETAASGNEQPVSDTAMDTPAYSGKGRKPWKAAPEFPPRTVKEVAEDTSLPYVELFAEFYCKAA